MVLPPSQSIAIKSLLKEKGYFKVGNKRGKPKTINKISLENITNVSAGVTRNIVSPEEGLIDEFIINVPNSLWNQNDLLDNTKSRGSFKASSSKPANNTKTSNGRKTKNPLPNAPSKPLKETQSTTAISSLKKKEEPLHDDDDEFIINISVDKWKASPNVDNQSDSDEEFILDLPQNAFQFTEDTRQPKEINVTRPLYHESDEEDFVVELPSFALEKIINNREVECADSDSDESMEFCIPRAMFNMPCK